MMDMQLKKITQIHYKYIKHIWERLRVFRGTKQQLPMISFDTISNMGLTIDNDREDLVSVISVLYHTN